MQVKTMHGNGSVDSKVVNKLVVIEDDGQNGVQLPKVYTRGEIPASTRQIATPTIGKQWEHLRCIEIPALDPDIEIGILVYTRHYHTLRGARR